MAHVLFETPHTAYFHGTHLKSAIDALMTGEPLKNCHPSKSASYTDTQLTSGKFPQSQHERVYLTPSLELAALYSWSDTREDWPDDFDEPVASPHIFAFRDFSGIENFQIDEDDVGWMAMDAILHISTGRNNIYNSNHDFCRAYQGEHNQNSTKHAKEILEYFFRLSEEILLPNKKLKYFMGAARYFLGERRARPKNLLTNPELWTELGLLWAPRLDEAFVKKQIALGANISVLGELYPDAYIEPYPSPIGRKNFSLENFSPMPPRQHSASENLSTFSL